MVFPPYFFFPHHDSSTRVRRLPLSFLPLPTVPFQGLVSSISSFRLKEESFLCPFLYAALSPWFFDCVPSFPAQKTSPEPPTLPVCAPCQSFLRVLEYVLRASFLFLSPPILTLPRFFFSRAQCGSCKVSPLCTLPFSTEFQL